MGRYDIPDPKCRHVQRVTMVSSHEDIVAAAKTSDPMASVWVCGREVCIEDAKEWVRAKTQREPHVRQKESA